MFHFRYGDFVHAAASQVQFVIRRGYYVAHHAAA